MSTERSPAQPLTSVSSGVSVRNTGCDMIFGLACLKMLCGSGNKSGRGLQLDTQPSADKVRSRRGPIRDGCLQLRVTIELTSLDMQRSNLLKITSVLSHRGSVTTFTRALWLTSPLQHKAQNFIGSSRFRSMSCLDSGRTCRHRHCYCRRIQSHGG